MTKQISNDDFPTAQISVNDPRCRAAIVETLHDLGWSVVEQPTGLHLIQEMSGLILGDQQSLSPGLIVADAAARGQHQLGAQGVQRLLEPDREPVRVVEAPDRRVQRGHLGGGPRARLVHRRLRVHLEAHPLDGDQQVDVRQAVREGAPPRRVERIDHRPRRLRPRADVVDHVPDEYTVL